MEPRAPSQPWPSGIVPSRAWTKTIEGAAYTVKRIDGALFGIWRDVEELGTFELELDAEEELRPKGADKLSLEARAVVREFIKSSQDEVFEGAARRDT